MLLTGKKFIDQCEPCRHSPNGIPKIRSTGRVTYSLIQSKVTLWHRICDGIGIKGFGPAVIVWPG